ncbi:BTB/POZ domain-containing protein 18 [Pleurodeles waltl]
MSNITYRSARLLRATFIQLHLQQKAGLFCDVFLHAEDEVISAHACVLSACSPFFTERLKGTRSSGQPRHLNLPGIKPITLNKLVHYLYTSELEVTREELDGVLAAARQLHIPELEVLQLQGVKLVRTDSWPRLNRKCFQTCDQPILRDAVKIKDAKDIKQELMPNPAGEKCRDVAVVESPSSRLSDTLMSVRCCQNPLEERYTDSEPSSSPLHTSSGVSESVSINSPTVSSCESLEPLPDSTESSTESGLQPVRRIKLSRFKFSMPHNNPRIPAPGRACDSLNITRPTSCHRTVATDKSQECAHFADSKNFTPSTQECLATSSVKKSVSKSVDGMAQHSILTKKNCSTSVDMKHLGGWEITNVHPQSQQSHTLQSRTNLAQVKTSETTHAFSRASDQNKSLSVTSSNTSGSVSCKESSKITNKSPEAKNIYKEHPLENLTQLSPGNTASALSCARKPRESVSSRPSSSVAGSHPSRDEAIVGQINITRSAQLQNGHTMHLLEEFKQLPLCGSADILSPSNDQKQSITSISRLPTVSSNTLGVGSQSQFTTGSDHSEIVNYRHPLEDWTPCESAQVSPPSSVRKSPGLSTANCTISADEGSRAQLKITGRTPQSEDDHNMNPMNGPGVCEPSNGLSPTANQMLSMAHPVQWHPSPTAVREDREQVHQSEEHLDLMLSSSATSQPAQEEQITITQERDVETRQADPALSPILMPICGADKADDVSKQSFPERRERDKEIKQHEVSVCTIRLLNNVPPCQDEIESVAVKLETHKVLTMDQTPLSVGADEARNTKCRKRTAVAGKKAAVSSQKRRQHDHLSLSTVKDFHKPRGSDTNTSSVVLQGRVSGGSDATYLDDIVSEHSDFRILTSTGEADTTVNSTLGSFFDSLIELSMPNEDEEIDVVGSVWNGQPDITSCCVRPDPSSESDMDVNVLD